jgi:PKD repeat protein
LLRTSEYPEAGRPFKFFMSKSSQGPEYALDFGDGSPKKVFKNGYVTHTFKKSGPCIVTLYASYEGQQVQLDTMRKIVARVKENAALGPVVDY